MSTDDHSFLQSELLREAKVIDAARGYVSVSSFNLRMKPAVLAAAARLIATQFNDDQVSVIHGIPHSGNYLATAVLLEMSKNHPDLRLHASRKDHSVPTSWKDIYRREIQSFTTSAGGFDVYSGITLSFARKGDRVLLLDDVCASGETGYNIVKGLQEKGVKVVGFAVLFDKLFQGGLERIGSLGVKTYSCVRVKELRHNDQVLVVSSPHD